MQPLRWVINGLWGGSELGPFISCQLNRSTQHMYELSRLGFRMPRSCAAFRLAGEPLYSGELENAPTNRSARKVLPEQAIGVLIRAALPGTLWVAEINVDFGRQRKATVICKFVSPSHVIPVPLSPTGCWQSCEPGLHFKTHKNGCGRLSTNLACRTAALISCLRGPRE